MIGNPNDLKIKINSAEKMQFLDKIIIQPAR